MKKLFIFFMVILSVSCSKSGNESDSDFNPVEGKWRLISRNPDPGYSEPAIIEKEFTRSFESFSRAYSNDGRLLYEIKYTYVIDEETIIGIEDEDDPGYIMIRYSIKENILTLTNIISWQIEIYERIVE